MKFENQYVRIIVNGVLTSLVDSIVDAVYVGMGVGLANTVEYIASEAKSRAPVRTGRLRDSIRAVMGSENDTSQEPFGQLVSLDIPTKTGMPLVAGVIADVPYACVVEIRKPFLLPAFTDGMNRLAEFFAEGIKDAFSGL
jgi:MFS superfamily sulfate permease-like transporter